MERQAALGLQVRKIWPQGKALEVTFRDDEDVFSPEEYEQVKSAIKDYANIWTQHANISFVFTNNQFETGVIRVSFTRGKGHNSYIGTDCATAVESHSFPTTNFDPNEINGRTLTTNSERFRQVVLHEFGHVLGCIHEHSQPNTKFKWNKAEVYEFYNQEYGWSRERTKANVLRRYESWSLYEGAIASTEYDPDSIMHYDLDGKFTQDGKPVIGGNILSTSDKLLIDKWYPLPSSGGVGTFEVEVEHLPTTPTGVHPVDVPLNSLWNGFAIRDVLFGIKDIRSTGLTLVSDFDAPPPKDLQNPIIRVRVPAPPMTGSPLRISWITVTSPRPNLQSGCKNVTFIYERHKDDDDDDDDDDDPPTREVEVKFPVQYAREDVPTVVAWFHSVESTPTSERGHSFSVTVTNINRTSFRLNCSVAARANCQLGITWLSYSTSRADLISDNVTFLGQKTLPDRTFSQSVLFPDKTFKQPPKVFVAFSSITTYKGNAYVSIDAPEAAVTPSGVTLNVSTSMRTALRRATVTYIATDSQIPRSSGEVLDDFAMFNFGGLEFR